MRRFAAKQEINISFVSKLLSKGEEPTDETAEGRRVRAALFLPRRKPKDGKPRRKLLPGEWHMRRRIGKMAKDTEKNVLVIHGKAK